MAVPETGKTQTIRVFTSVATVSVGLPSGRRVTGSTTVTSALVWSIWTISSGSLATSPQAWPDVAPLGLVLALSSGHQFSLVMLLQPAPQTADRGWGQPLRPTIGSNFAPEPCPGGLTTGSIKPLEMAGHDRFHQRVQGLHARFRAPCIPEQCRGPPILAELLHQAKERGSADIQLMHGPFDSAWAELDR